MVGPLELLSKQFAELGAMLESYVKPLSSTDRLEKLTLPPMKKGDADAFTDSIIRQLTSDMPAEKRDEAISRGEAPKDVKPDLKRPEVLGNVPLWILTLRAYTIALKNLENMPKAKKEQHLKVILEGWSTVMLYACIAFKEIIEKREIQLGSVKFKFDLPKDIDARVVRIIFLHIPIVISDIVRRDLGSEKLAVQLRNENLASTLSDLFLQTSVYADLKLDEYLKQLKALKDRVTASGSRVFLESILIKMREIYLRLGLRADEQDGFLRVAAELSAEIKGLTGEERKREIDRYSTDLRRSDQIQKLRETRA